MIDEKNTILSTDVSFWEQVKDNLTKKNSGNKLLQTWFEPTTLVNTEMRDNGKCFYLGVPNELHKYWLAENFLDKIFEEISQIYTKPFQVDLIVTGQELNYKKEEPKEDVSATLMEQINKPDSSSKRKSFLNNDYLFNTFVVGRNNEFAHAACYNIADNPGKSPEYNPLFICGPTGMGKTHLLNAVGNHISQRFPQLKISYFSAERFLNECISAIRHKETDKFRKNYREGFDIMLVDDVQILGRGESVQDEFFYLLDDFISKGKQVVVASDRMPKDIQALADRIRTRLEWGVIADIQMPDFETRMAILRYKAEQRGIKLPEEVITYIAKISKRSIRELEGNLNKLKMYTELQGLPINNDLAKQVLSTHSNEGSVLTIQDIQKLVADHFNVKQIDLKGTSRSKPLVVARQVAMFLVKNHLDKSLQDIGRAFGGRDHSTVINALRRVQNQQEKDSDLRKDIEDLESRIHNLTGV
ncbi:MAG: chromosomal replication initiator protein DnaA [Bdellovibrionales bacterium]|nr:chromosomal replication initiator protein DnaA [Bdellovibrionales bacterium]